MQPSELYQLKNPNLSAVYLVGWMLECVEMSSKYFDLLSNAGPFHIVPEHAAKNAIKQTMQTMPMTMYPHVGSNVFMFMAFMDSFNIDFSMITWEMGFQMKFQIVF